MAIRRILLLLTLAVVCSWAPGIRAASAQGPSSSTEVEARASQFVGAWTLNKGLTARTGDNGDDGARGARGGDRGGFGGGRRGGGRRGGVGGRGGEVGGDADATARMRQAIQDLANPPDHLTIVASGSLIILTAADGRATRLSPDGKKIKDDNTGITRKTRWDGNSLVSDVSGVPNIDATQTFSVDNTAHQFRITAELTRGGRKQTLTNIYDLDPR